MLPPVRLECSSGWRSLLKPWAKASCSPGHAGAAVAWAVLSLLAAAKPRGNSGASLASAATASPVCAVNSASGAWSVSTKTRSCSSEAAWPCLIQRSTSACGQFPVPTPAASPPMLAMSCRYERPIGCSLASGRTPHSFSFGNSKSCPSLSISCKVASTAASIRVSIGWLTCGVTCCPFFSRCINSFESPIKSSATQERVGAREHCHESAMGSNTTLE
mmetsp:Transcript_28484/g.90777  ORF Transcript_28484/g.90777 Transcript_28484/m.90777 type:complete len:218 (-) Transcript_28484:822-1475(-)